MYGILLKKILLDFGVLFWLKSCVSDGHIPHGSIIILFERFLIRLLHFYPTHIIVCIISGVVALGEDFYSHLLGTLSTHNTTLMEKKNIWGMWVRDAKCTKEGSISTSCLAIIKLWQCWETGSSMSWFFCVMTFPFNEVKHGVLVVLLAQFVLTLSCNLRSVALERKVGSEQRVFSRKIDHFGI